MVFRVSEQTAFRATLPVGEKKERAPQRSFAVTVATRWMGTSRTRRAGLTAQLIIYPPWGTAVNISIGFSDDGSDCNLRSQCGQFLGRLQLLPLAPGENARHRVCRGGAELLPVAQVRRAGALQKNRRFPHLRTHHAAHKGRSTGRANLLLVGHGQGAQRVLGAFRRACVLLRVTETPTGDGIGSDTSGHVATRKTPKTPVIIVQNADRRGFWLASRAGLEPPTCGLEVRCSVQLSYRNKRFWICDFGVRMMGKEEGSCNSQSLSQSLSFPRLLDRRHILGDNSQWDSSFVLDSADSRATAARDGRGSSGPSRPAAGRPEPRRCCGGRRAGPASPADR